MLLLLFLTHSLLFFVVRERGNVHATVQHVLCYRSEEALGSLFSPTVDSQHQTHKSSGLHGKCFYQLNHLASPLFYLFFNFVYMYTGL